MGSRLATLLLLLLPWSALAQAPAQTLAMGPFADDTVKPAPTMSAPRPTPGPNILPPIIAPAKLGSFQVVEVPVPVTQVHAGSLRWSVDATRPVALLSPRDGVINTASTSAAPHRSLLVTLAVPNRARAGLLPAATVRYTEAGGRSVEVPVHLLVANSRSIEITVAEARRGVRPGERFALRFRMTNLGNAPERVEVRAELPASWHATFQGDRISDLGTHAMVERSMTVSVPRGAATGAAVVRVIALVDGVPVASAESRITVQHDDRTASDGATATITAAMGVDAGGRTTNGLALAIEGPLTDQINVSARMSHTRGDTDGSYALARAGMYPMRPSVRFAAPHWSLSLGVMGETFTDLTGTGVGGQGVSGSVRRGRVKATALLGRSITNSSQATGLLAGGTLAVDAGRVIVSATASHLTEQHDDPRRLQAISLQAHLPEFLSGALAAEVAQRWTARGGSPGAAVSFEHQSGTGGLSLRAMHAPGGSGAFARASNEVAVAASRAVGDLMSLSGSISASEDQGSSALGRLNALSASFGVARRMNRVLGVSIAVQHNAFGTDGTAAGFGTSQTEASLAMVANVAGVRVRAAAATGEVARSTRFAGQGAVEESGDRQTVEGSVHWTGTHGSLDLTGRLERNDIRSGTLPQQVEVSLRATNVPLTTIGGIRLVAGAELRRNAWPGFAPARWTTGMTAEAQLPLGLAVAATAERNPYLQGNGQGGWLYGFRVARTIGLPRAVSGTVRGVVFDDRNGNGTRDRDESGLANVVVRHAGGTAITDRAGRYSFADPTASQVDVDPASLPIGMVPSPNSRHPGALAMVSVAPVRVELTMARDSLERGRRVDLRRAVVMARHASGRSWIARSVAPGAAVFDALPPGRYQVVLDLLDITEPVEPREALPTFEVHGGVAPATIAITLHARRVSIKQIDPTSPVPIAVTR